MPRKGPVAKREVLPDPIFHSKDVTRLINRVMVDGKRGTAASIIYKAFDIIKESTGNDPLEVFTQAMENVKPVLEVKARRVGGSNYQVPVEVRPERQTALGLRWLASFARKRGEHTMEQRLAKEIVDAFFAEISAALEKGEEVKLSGFGNFQVRDKPSRPGRNPKTGESIPISARRVVTFHASQKLKTAVENTDVD